jgi:oligoribonuclease NrnB/cAMP/cGMP phosphodiesterase (DHH superfamily)
MDPNTIDILVYHSPCQDGLAAAYVAYKYSKEHNLTYEFIGITNNQNEFSDTLNIKDKNVIFFDIAPNDIQLKQLKENNTNFYIVDHHKTNESRLKNYTNGIFDMNKSGAGLAWDYFYPKQPMPLFLQMIQDRDLWKWEIPRSKEFCNGLFTYGRLTNTLQESFDLFESIHSDSAKYEEVLTVGSILDRKRAKEIDSMAKNAAEKVYSYKGYTVCIVNCDHEFASDLGHTILTTFGYDFVVCWRYNHMNEEYWLSLRADNKVDVSDICKEYGGGGHKNAAGCTTKIHPSVLFSTPYV